MQGYAEAIMAVGFFTAITVTVRSVAGIVRARIERRPLELPRGVEERLERIEGAVEAIAVEVERVAEAQRYALRLEQERSLAQLGAPAGPAPMARAITPH